MPKGLVVYLDDETYKQLKIISAKEGQSLKDFVYEVIKGVVDCHRDPKELLEQLKREAPEVYYGVPES